MTYRIPFNKPFLAGRELYYIENSVVRGHTSGDGPYTGRCQSLMQDKFNARQILLTTSCTSALEMCAILCDVKKGDEVILPSYTFVSTANAFSIRGARLKFLDIRPDTLNLDERLLDAAITERTRVIAPVHYAGVSCEMDRINAIAKRSNIQVVEDAAQGVNATYKGKHLGTLGNLGCYSFHETKNFSCGEGGALVVNNPRFIERAEIIREKGTNRSQFFRGQVEKYTWVDIGSSYLPSDLLAAFLFGQLEQMDKINRTRKTIYECYYAKLSPLAERGLITLPVIPQHCESNYHMFHILLDSEETRGRLIEALKQQGILAVFHYVPVHTSPMGEKLGYSEGMLPVTEQIAKRVLRLPFYFQLTEAEIEAVIGVLFDVLLKRAR